MSKSIEQARSRYISVPGIDATVVEEIVGSLRAGKEGTRLNNDVYRLRLPSPGAIHLQIWGNPATKPKHVSS